MLIRKMNSMSALSLADVSKDSKLWQYFYNVVCALMDSPL